RMFSSGNISRMTRAPSSITPNSKPPHSSGKVRSPWRLICSSCSDVSLTLIPEFLAQIFAGVIAQDGDDDALVNSLGDCHCRDDVGPGRNPDEPAFATRQPFDHVMRVFRADFELFVRDRRIVDARHDRRLHMLHPFKAVKRGIGLHRDQFHAWLKFSQPSPGPNEGPARAKARDEMGDAPRGLLEYFNARRLVMRSPVGRIVVLIGVKIL